MPKKSKFPKMPKNQSNYKSGFEEQIVKQLDSARCPFEYEPQGFPIKVEKNYWPDFKIGSMYIETKGLLDKDAKEKLVAFKKAYPDVDLRIVFQADNFLHKLSKGSRKKRLDKVQKGGKLRERERYSDWAKKHGFKVAVGRIPKEWLEE